MNLLVSFNFRYLRHVSSFVISGHVGTAGTRYYTTLFSYSVFFYKLVFVLNFSNRWDGINTCVCVCVKRLGRGGGVGGECGSNARRVARRVTLWVDLFGQGLVTVVTLVSLLLEVEWCGALPTDVN